MSCSCPFLGQVCTLCCCDWIAVGEHYQYAACTMRVYIHAHSMMVCCTQQQLFTFLSVALHTDANDDNNKNKKKKLRINQLEAIIWQKKNKKKQKREKRQKNERETERKAKNQQKNPKKNKESNQCTHQSWYSVLLLLD